MTELAFGKEIALGLEGITINASTISDVDGVKGKLVYGGYDIEDLARNSNFEEVTYLLWFGVLPKSSQLNKIQNDLAQERDLPDALIQILKLIPKNANPMSVIRTAISALGNMDSDAEDKSAEAFYRKSIRCTSKTATIIAYYDRIRQGKELVHPVTDLSHAANFLYMLNSEKPSKIAERALDAALILHADHSCNASTFAGRVVASTLSDYYSSITAAVGALKGPLHGGANEEVMHMLYEIGTIDKVEEYVLSSLNKKGGRIMGFGHRIYKSIDPRAAVLRDLAVELFKGQGNKKYFEILKKVEEITLREMKLKDKLVYPNVDFYSGWVYDALGLKMDLFPPIFALARVAGWTAHYKEQLVDNRIYRPLLQYTGPKNLKWQPVVNR